MQRLRFNVIDRVAGRNDIMPWSRRSSRCCRQEINKRSIGDPGQLSLSLSAPTRCDWIGRSNGRLSEPTGCLVSAVITDKVRFRLGVFLLLNQQRTPLFEAQ